MVANGSERMLEVEMKRFVWFLSVLLLVPSVSSCGCDLILRVDRNPSTVTVAVGETAPPPQALLYGCGTPRLTVRFEDWRSENPNIASVGTNTGVITGVAPGEVTVIGFGVAVSRGEDIREAVNFPVTVVAATTAAR